MQPYIYHRLAVAQALC